MSHYTLVAQKVCASLVDSLLGLSWGCPAQQISILLDAELAQLSHTKSLACVAVLRSRNTENIIECRQQKELG